MASPNSPSKETAEQPILKRLKLSQLLIRNSIVTSSVVTKRNLVAQKPIFPTSFMVYEDYAAWLHLSVKANIYQCSASSVFYNVSGNKRMSALRKASTKTLFFTYVHFLRMQRREDRWIVVAGLTIMIGSFVLIKSSLGEVFRRFRANQ